MFTKPINEIEYEDVKNYCNVWGEGFHVEYKREIKDYKEHIPKIVSSFANYQGGILIIGVECDRKKNKVISIDGIPARNDIEEQIQHIAITHIYHPITPTVKIVGIPDSDNVLVVVYVDESVQVPHTIKNKKEVYIRSGNINYPYELADIDLVEYMFKRRSDSQVVGKQIIARIEDRASYLLKRRELSPYKQLLTVSVQPTFPYRPIISPSIIYGLHYPQNNPPSRIDGGVCYFSGNECFEFNEYGFVSRSTILPDPDKSEKYIRFGDILYTIDNYLEYTRKFFQECGYLGNIEFKMQLQNVSGYTMVDLVSNGRNTITNLSHEPKCAIPEVIALQRCLARDLGDRKTRLDIVEELIGKILWSFDIPTDNQQVRDLLRKRIDGSVK